MRQKPPVQLAFEPGAKHLYGDFQIFKAAELCLVGVAVVRCMELAVLVGTELAVLDACLGSVDIVDVPAARRRHGDVHEID